VLAAFDGFARPWCCRAMVNGGSRASSRHFVPFIQIIFGTKCGVREFAGIVTGG
jgi:hypothetical protein